VVVDNERSAAMENTVQQHINAVASFVSGFEKLTRTAAAGAASCAAGQGGEELGQAFIGVLERHLKGLKEASARMARMARMGGPFKT